MITRLFTETKLTMTNNFPLALMFALSIAITGGSDLSAADISLSWKVIPLAVDANEGIDIADFDGDGNRRFW